MLARGGGRPTGRSSSMLSEVELEEIRILDAAVKNRDVAEYMRALPPGEREQPVIHAVEVCVFDDSSTTQ